jgi:hypothetical protein
MHDALLVRRLEAFCDLTCQRQRIVNGDRPEGDPRGERGTGDEFQRQRLHVVRLHEPVNGGDVRMVERGKDVRFAFEGYHDVRTSCPRPLPPPAGSPEEPWLPCSPNVANKIRTYEITLPNGSRLRRSSSEPGRLLLIGDNADFQKFDVPNLRGISRTAPYFINNSAKTLEDVLQQYRAFFAFQNRIAATPSAPGFGIISTDGINRDRPFTPEEEMALLAYLRKL